MSTYHTPVLLEEVIKGLAVEPGKKYIDATAGGGGHTLAMLKLGAEVCAIDTDDDAIAVVQQRMTEEGIPQKQWCVRKGNFADIGMIAIDAGFMKVDGVLFDLGVSSHQLNTAERGFSYRYPDVRIDARLDQHAGQSAADLLEQVAEEDLYEIIATFGEEERAGAISRALVRSRKIAPIQTTGDVVRIVSDAIPGSAMDKQKTLSRVFQALRIAVNDELQVLKKGLVATETLLRPGGRLAVISFHSLEDRIVKQYTQKSCWNVINKRPIIPTEKEIVQNGRARSAKLRLVRLV